MYPEPNDVPEPSLRESLEAAFDSQETPQDAPAAREPEVSDPPGRTEDKPGEGGDPVRERDERGRFLPKETIPARKPDADDHGAAAAKGGARGAAATVVAPPPANQGTPPNLDERPPEVKERAPQSWRPTAREHWAALPPDVRQEVMRRETEVARTLQETAAARREAEAFRAAVSPYEAMIRAEGGDPLRAVSNLLQTAAALRTAPPVMKAQMMAQVVRTFGIPIDALDAALAGMPLPAGQPLAPPQDPRVDQLLSRLEAYQQEQARSLQESAQTEIEDFGKTHEFFEDVREDMADLIEVAAKRGQILDPQKAYDRAVAMNPEIASVVEQRKAAANAQKARASTVQARRASLSVKTVSPTSPVSSQGEKASLRDDLESALEQLSGR